MAFVNGTWVKLFDWLRDLWREEPILRARLDAEFSGIAATLTATGDASTWVTFTPIIASTTGTLTTVASVAGRYVQIGTFVYWSASFTITTNGSGATSLDVPLPVKAAASPSGANAPTYGKETAVTGKGLTGYNATILLGRFTFYDGTYPGGDGRTYRVGGSYEAASTGAVTDTTPDAFTFTDITNATISTLYTSNTITIAGIDAPAAISISGGWQYSINGGAYTSTAGTVSNLSTVTVQLTSSSSALTAVSAALTVGGISDTYTVTTAAAGVLLAEYDARGLSSGGLGTWLDETANNNDLVQAVGGQQGVVFQNVYGTGLHTVRFSGAEFMDCTSLTGANNAGHTTFIVAKQNSTQVGYFLNITDASNDGSNFINTHIWRSSTSVISAAYGNEGGATTADANITNLRIIEAVTTPSATSTRRIFIDGTEGTPEASANATNNTPTKIRIGVQWNGTFGFNYISADICHIRIYKGLLSDAERTAVRAQLQAIWSTP